MLFNHQVKLQTAHLYIFILSLLVSASPGCGAQNKNGAKLSSKEAWRIEVTFRSVAQLPPEAEIHLGSLVPSDLPGFDQIELTYSVQGVSSKPLLLLLSKDRKVLAQFRKFDNSEEHQVPIGEAGRPGRGGQTNAPVSIIVFDDLECPFCARLNAELFPAVHARYGGQVRIVYREFPIAGHPWALRAAIDTMCLAKQSSSAYWETVDLIHSQAGTLGGPASELAKVAQRLDQITIQAGTHYNVDNTALRMCIDKQDSSSVIKSRNDGEELGVESTPTLFINGAKIEGAISMSFLYTIIDKALTAQGITPPSEHQSGISTMVH